MQRPPSLQDKALVSGRKVGNMVVSLEQARKEESRGEGKGQVGKCGWGTEIA